MGETVGEKTKVFPKPASSPRSNPQPPFVARSKVFAVKAKLPVVLCTMYMAGRAKTECKICKTVVMRREGATNRKKQLTLIPTIGVRTGAVSGGRHLHFGRIKVRREILGLPWMPRSILGSIYQAVRLIRFK